MRFIISTPSDLHEALKICARQRGTTLTGLIRAILWDWLRSQADTKGA